MQSLSRQESIIFLVLTQTASLMQSSSLTGPGTTLSAINIPPRMELKKNFSTVYAQ